MKSILYTILLLAAAPLLAHDAGGCSCCKAPGTFAPPHGGIVEHTKNHNYIEVVADREQVTLYFLDSDLETLPIDNIEIAGKIRMPRRSKSPQTLSFTKKHGRFIADVSIESSTHRYILDLTVQADGTHEKMRFQVEPDA